MFSAPSIGSQLAAQRHHDLQAQAGQQRPRIPRPLSCAPLLNRTVAASRA